MFVALLTGWFWSGSGVRIAATNSTPTGWSRSPWSHTGFIGQFLGKEERRKKPATRAKYDRLWWARLFKGTYAWATFGLFAYGITCIESSLIHSWKINCTVQVNQS